jgi:hypothetical protein
MKMKIISAPPGEASQEIREDWIGLTLSILESELQGIPVSVVKDPTKLEEVLKNRGGYPVSLKEAIEALEKAGKQKAANYWKDFLPWCDRLVFAKDCAILV